jgi:hypothetical protein
MIILVFLGSCLRLLLPLQDRQTLSSHWQSIQ